MSILSRQRFDQSWSPPRLLVFIPSPKLSICDIVQNQTSVILQAGDTPLERSTTTMFELPASSPAQPSIHSEPPYWIPDRFSEAPDNLEYHITQSINSSEASTQILGSSPPDSASTVRHLSPPVSSWHLASGGSSNDTFAEWKRIQVFRTRDFVVGGVELLSDPFVQSEPGLDAEQPTREKQDENTAKETVTVENQISGTPTRWSEEYDQLPDNMRLTQMAANQWELRDRGYYLKTPPMITNWQQRNRVLAADVPSESDDAEIVVQLPQPDVEEQQNFVQQRFSPQEIPPMMSIEAAANDAWLAFDDMAARLETLAHESRTHSWNAGVFGGRLAVRDRELAEARWNVSIRDVQIRRLCDVIAEKEEETETEAVRNCV